MYRLIEYIFMCTYISICVYVPIRVDCVNTYIYVYVYLYMCMYIYVFLQICLCVHEPAVRCIEMKQLSDTYVHEPIHVSECVYVDIYM